MLLRGNGQWTSGIGGDGQRAGDHAGAIDVDATNEDTTVNTPTGSLRIVGSGGRARVIDPRQHVSIDMHRAAIELTL